MTSPTPQNTKLRAARTVLMTSAPAAAVFSIYTAMLASAHAVPAPLNSLVLATTATIWVCAVVVHLEVCRVDREQAQLAQLTKLAKRVRGLEDTGEQNAAAIRRAIDDVRVDATVTQHLNGQRVTPFRRN